MTNIKCFLYYESMDKQYNLYNFEASFKEYLIAGNTKPVSIKNYLSDFRHFSGWLVFKFKVQNSNFKVFENPVEFVSLINLSIIEEYKEYLASNNIPHKTINRRLSTIRKFCSFCISQGWIKENPGKQVQNAKFKVQSNSAQSISDEILNQYIKNNVDKNINLEHIKEFFHIINL